MCCFTSFVYTLHLYLNVLTGDYKLNVLSVLLLMTPQVDNFNDCNGAEYKSISLCLVRMF